MGIFDRFANWLTQDPDHRRSLVLALIHAVLLPCLVISSVFLHVIAPYLQAAKKVDEHGKLADAGWVEFIVIGSFHTIELLFLFTIVIIVFKALIEVFTTLPASLGHLVVETRKAWAKAVGPIANEVKTKVEVEPHDRNEQ